MESNVFVPVSSVNRKFKSKKDIYYSLKYQCKQIINDSLY